MEIPDLKSTTTEMKAMPRGKFIVVNANIKK